MSRRTAELLAAWLPPVAAMGGIWVLSSLPDLRPPGPAFPHKDKVLHALQYGLLGLLFARAAVRTWPRRPARAAFFGFALTAAFGLLDELHQAFVPGRDGDWLDWLADVLGAAGGALLHRAWRRRATPTARGAAGASSRGRPGGRREPSP